MSDESAVQGGKAALHRVTSSSPDPTTEPAPATAGPGPVPPTSPAEAAPASAGRLALRIEHLSKTFPGTRALQDVSFDVGRGQVHALLGGNGSGKSTLIKILAGVYHADAGGTITVGDSHEAADRTSPEWAKAAGLRFVHQNPGVFPALSVAENLAIGHGFETGPLGAVRWRALRKRAQSLIDRFDIHARPGTPVSALRPADRTMVAIARALQDQEGEHSGLLVLDEPTASLPESEVKLLLAALRRFAAAGQSILYVSHRLDEVLSIADEVTVLRDGQLAASRSAKGLTEQDLIEMIVGRALDRVFPEMPEVRSEDLVLEVRNLAGGPLRDASLALKKGEVLGIAGLLGSGRSELLKMVFGGMSPVRGEVRLDGKAVRFANVDQAMRAGIAYVPEDRVGEAAFLDMSVRENVSAAEVGKYWRGGLLRHRHEAKDAAGSIRSFFIKAHSQGQSLNTLSGGNQQKVIIARWLRREPKVLLLDEPTQGVDVSARAEIYALVRAAVERGTSVLVVTSDFEELSRVCDRVVVLAQGRIVAEVLPPHIDPSRLTELAFATQEVAV